MGTGDYTVDMWVFRTAETANEQGIFQIHPSAPSTDYQNSIGLDINIVTLIVFLDITYMELLVKLFINQVQVLF